MDYFPLCTLELGVGHNDLAWGSAWFICREAWDMVKYLIGSMNSSYNSPCGLCLCVVGVYSIRVASRQ